MNVGGYTNKKFQKPEGKFDDIRYANPLNEDVSLSNEAKRTAVSKLSQSSDKTEFSPAKVIRELEENGHFDAKHLKPFLNDFNTSSVQKIEEEFVKPILQIASRTGRNIHELASKLENEVKRHMLLHKGKTVVRAQTQFEDFSKQA